MEGLVKKIALLALINQRSHDRNGNLVAKRNFKVKLRNGQVVHVHQDQHLLLGENRLGIGTLAFEQSDDDGLITSLLKVFGNAKVSDFNYIDWDDIVTISG